MGKKEMKNCLHPEEKISAGWKYIGKDLVSGTGFCELCGANFEYCEKADKLVLKKKVQKSLREKFCVCGRPK